MTHFRLLDTGLLTAAENMALDEIITRRVGAGLSPPTLRFLRFSPDAALVGFHQEAERELRLDYCAQQGIEVNRRVTGGGALLFQESSLGWEIIAPWGQGPFAGGFNAALERICLAAARGISSLGIEACFRPRNDIEVDGRKISGTGGMVLEGGALFQGTVLVVNEIERFLKALRVPVEKLKRREIESLMERMAFLEDLLGRPLPMAELKQVLADGLSQGLGLSLEPGGLTEGERDELAQRLPYFSSEEWLRLKSLPSDRPAWLRHYVQGDGGSMQVHLWLDKRGARVQKALISGDFFARPQRLVPDLEAALMGAKAQLEQLRRVVEEFFANAPGELVGITPSEVARAVAQAGARLALARELGQENAAELFLVNLAPEEALEQKAAWLLLPYCSKPPDCEFRYVSDCGVCGDCQFTAMITLGHELGLEPVSIQSFEHLMENLRRIHQQGGWFLGSCCEAFYTKHQREIEESGARGVLVNLDSTTCYDLGKGMAAYAGHFDNQTEMNTALIEKVARRMGRA
ncbi:lipoate--protein ligase family protein [Desulfoferula mesophila]|uniref:Biotin/lipoate A/B protein ligase n=1 Tax=Desulfoferula mesophila TaxID=3058419 RepID=A0AAU9EHT3_9BACT|nr:biotin/lipoate A/B protein ligase [Desulfoferula mesophilus]